jgi:hypothetical protein
MPLRDHPTHAKHSWLGLIPAFSLASLTVFLKDAAEFQRLVGRDEALFLSILLCGGAVGSR